ncbi:MAG TPA: hypothetical protein VKG79_15140 [Bryobacteraceae bacterium]|nr:hypothetical protein [Bryobacteraceae bacterium]
MAVFAIAQTPIRHGDVSITAGHPQDSGSIRQLTGNVVIETDSMVLHADKADYNPDTQEILAQGDVRVKLK